MGYLFSVFKNQVEEYCEFSEIENCNDELMKYGLKRLKDMPENHLDEMDPYQRGASSISKFVDDLMVVENWDVERLRWY